MRKSLDGSTEGLCTLSDNITCEEWAYYKGDCPAGSKRKVETSTNTPTATTTDMTGEAVTSTEPINTRQDSKDTGDSKDSTLGLSAEPGDPGEIVTKWKTNGLESPEGFIAILSGTPGITGMTKFNHIVRNPDSRSFTWNNLVAGRKYYFRVCTLVNEACGEFSPEQSAIAQ